MTGRTASIHPEAKPPEKGFQCGSSTAHCHRAKHLASCEVTPGAVELIPPAAWPLIDPATRTR